MTNETTAPSGTESRILDQIVAEITGVIAKMDEGDIERAMPLIGKTGRVYATGEGRSGLPGAQLCHAHDAHRLHQ